MPERILDADVDAELLRRNRLGESHAALARAFGCSKTLVQRRIRRAEAEERRLGEERCPARAHSANERPDQLWPNETRLNHHAGGAPARSGVNIRERLEHEALHSKDSRSRIAALKELRELEKQPAGQELATEGPSIYTLRVGTLILEPEKWRKDYDSEHPTYRLMCRIRGGMEHVVDRLTPPQVLQCLGIALRVWTPEQLDAAEAALRREREYTPLADAELAELDERIVAERARRRSRLAGKIWELRRQAAAAQ